MKNLSLRAQKFFAGMKEVKKYEIDYRNLKEGAREWEYSITGDFFTRRGSALISEGELDVRLDLLKKSSLGLLTVSHIGQIKTNCDRCLEDLLLEIKGSIDLIVKEGRDRSDEEEEEVVYVDENGKLILDQVLYDYISLSVPMIKYCDTDPPCNSAVMTKVLSDDDDNRSHPAWSELRKLKF